MSEIFPPDFIIIGAMRAGTTALAERLSRHPDIAMSRLKETDYFITEKNYDRGPEWYRSLFDPARAIRGEASPNYTKNDVFAGVPQRIRAARPDVKLIYIVRDPVERFWSHYNHTYLMRGGLPSPDDLLEEREGAHILASSMYRRQLDAYLDVFPAEQIRVVDLDDFAFNAPRTLDEVCRFVGAAPDVHIAGADAANSAESLAKTPGWALKISQHKALVGLRAKLPADVKDQMRRALSRVQARPRQTPPISEAARRRVSDALAEDAAQFRALTGRSFDRWSV
ncbi:MAG: sulfotransferase [Amphiplicatus sp.]